jgi:hypothetical protein
MKINYQFGEMDVAGAANRMRARAGRHQSANDTEYQQQHGRDRGAGGSAWA